MNVGLLNIPTSKQTLRASQSEIRNLKSEIILLPYLNHDIICERMTNAGQHITFRTLGG